MKVYLVIAHDNDNGGEEETYLAQTETPEEDQRYMDDSWVGDELAKFGLTDNDIHFYAMSGDKFEGGVMKMGEFDYTFVGEMED